RGCVFQAEDGIRDRNVTGVQTCALPILTEPRASTSAPARSWTGSSSDWAGPTRKPIWPPAPCCPRQPIRSPTAGARHSSTGCPVDRKSVVQGKRVKGRARGSGRDGGGEE